MMGFNLIHSENNLRSILKKFFILAIILTVINVSEENKVSDEDFQRIKNDPETVAPATGNFSKASNIKKIADDRSSSRAVIKSRENSPALKSFLRNVLQAQDELKWIDQAVRRVGTKESQEKSPLYSSRSLNHDSGPRYRRKNRLKRLSGGNELYEIESWPSPKRKYHDYEDAGNLNQSIYPEEEDEEDEEMKVKRSTLDKGSAPAVDDATLRRWARKEGLKVPGGWFDYEESPGGSNERENRMKDSIEPRWVENPAREENFGEVSGKNSEDSKAGGEPTLESLKRTVLELSRSLAESDRKMEELGKRGARNRERHVEDLAGRKEGRSKGEHERAMSNYAKESSSFEDSNWWNDPRSAAEIFDFERRDDGEMDEEDEDDDPESGNSELDYMMQRVKRENGEQDGVRVRVYRRAGFGGSYLEPLERGKRSGSKREPEEKEIEKNSLGVSGSYGAGVSEIRGTGLDKIINGENLDGGEEFKGRRNVNENENDDNFGGEDKVMNKPEEKLNAEKGTEGGTVGDSNLEELKTAASISAGEKRSLNLRGREESRQILSATEAETPLDEFSSNRIKSRLDGLLKNAAAVPQDQKSTDEKYHEDIMPVKIVQRNEDVNEKIAENSNDRKKDEGLNRRDLWRESKAQKKLTDNIDKDSEELKVNDSEEVLEKVKREEKLGKDESNENENLKPEDKLDKMKDEKDSDSGDKLNIDSKIENKDNQDNEKEKSKPIDQDSSRISKITETRSEQEANLSSNEDKKFEKTDSKSGLKEPIKREESTRKLLWLSSDRLTSKDFKEIRKNDGKTDQQPSNDLEGLKFMKRSLMAAGDRSVRNNVSDKIRRRRKMGRKGRKRSVKSYPENMEDDNAMEEIAREDKEDVHRSYARKRSLKKPTEYRKERDVAEELYQVKYQGFGEDDEAVRDSGVRNQGWENASVMESETQDKRSVVGSSHRDGDRDPIRDRINMLIKQKLDDRGKEKQAHLKREVGMEARSIEYYDYEGDVGGSESEVGSSGSENDQPQNVTSQETSTSTTSEASSNYTSETSSTDSSDSMNKKDEITEEERKQALQHEEMNNRDAKEEFIPDSSLTTTQKRLPQVGDTTVDGESTEGDQNQSKDEEIKNILRGGETGDENNERRRENEIQKSNYDHWLAQPAEANPEEQDTPNIPKDRYQENEEPKERDRTVENGNTDVLEEPFDYGVNGNGKIDPDSLDDVLKEKSNTKDREEDAKDSRKSANDERDQENPVDNYKSNDESMSADDRWKYEEIRDKTQPDDRQRVEDEEIEGRSRNEKLSRRHWSSKDLARIEEENNDEESSEDFLSLNSEDQDQIIEDKNHSKEIVDEDNTASRESRLIDDSAEDSLPTMLDRSGPKNFAPGEGTYLMIAPDSELECPRKRTSENTSSSSSGSNYFALKTTDDMFKGGIEQSNPPEDKISEPDIMKKTTTEWRVINMGDDARAKPVTGRYPSAPLDDLKLDIERGSNSLNKFPLVEYQELDLNPRDVLHESIVDPEEMSADFDDDLMPRLGRSLQSVSYPIDHFDGADGKSRDDERPAEKYLENTQIGFERKDENGSKIAKRVMDASYVLKEEKYHESDAESGLKKTAELNPQVNKDSELTRKNVNVNAVGENVAKRYSEDETEPSNRDDDQRIDKDKRGLTNVEEWEMNAPDVQKQRMMTRSAENGVKDFSGDEREKKLKEVKDENLDSNLKTGDKSLSDLESHERETRSIQSKNPNPEFYSPRVDIGGRSDMRSKIWRKKKSNENYLSKSGNPFGSNFRDNWSNERGTIGDNSLDNIVNIRNRRVFKKRSGSSGENKKSNGKESSSKKREPDNRMSYSSSKRDKLSREKIVNGGGTNRRHSSSREVKKRRGGSPLKKRKNRKDVLRGGHAKYNNGMVSTAAEDSLVAPKAFDSGMRGAGERRVLDESAEDGGDNTGRDNNEDEKKDQKKKFKVLFSADNMEDESQMDLALHGELAGKIVEKIFDQVQKNDALKLALGPGLFRKHKSEDSVESDKIYRQGLDEDEVKHTEEMMRRVMELLGRLVLDEVQRKTCASLPPDMREFLQWMLGVEDEYRSSDEAPPLPLVHSQEPNHHQGDKFLFGGQPGNTENGDLDELNKKVKLLKALINEYNSLSSKEKTKVQTVHDYLVKQLGLLMRYIEAKEGERVKGGDVGFRGGNILQYQNAGPNSNDSIASQSTLPPLVHTPSLLMLSNASFGVDHPYRSVIPEHFSLRRREARSSDHGVKKRAKKRKKHKKHKSRNKHRNKNKNKKKHGKLTGGESLQYKKLIRKAALLRKKRADLYEDDWDPVDSGYEEPAIYNSSGELANGVGEQRSSQKTAKDNSEKRNDPYFWADVLSGKSNDDEEANDGKSSAPDGPQEESNFAEKLKMNSETAPVKRDVISASVALQPWINPKPDDQISQEYFDKLTEELVHKVSVPPIYPTTREGKEKNKRKVGGRSLADEEVMLLSKRDDWKAKNEQQLEEVAFGKDMRGKWEDEERFKKLTEMDRKKNEGEGTKRQKRGGLEGFAKEGKTVNERTENGKGNVEGEVTAAMGEDNVGEVFGAATGETVNSVSEKVRNLKATVGSENSVREIEVPRMIEGLQPVVPKMRLVNSIPDPTKCEEQKDETEIASLKDEAPKKEDDDSLQEEGKSPSVSRLVLSWEKKNSKISDDNEERKNGFRNRFAKKEYPVIKKGVKGSAILSSFEKSSKQKQLTSKDDDHRDPDDRTLGLESPFIIGLNTY